MSRKPAAAASRRDFQRGQTAVLALLVMLLLAFAGALFVTIVARNLVNARHQNRVETADYYADSGIHYADDQLTNSVLGADWRPPTPPKPPVLAANDPDFDLLNATPPYTRYNMGNGRFLIRVSYVPTLTVAGAATLKDPLAGYIKIESVGREGTVDTNDPTTFNAGKHNATLIAWKSIGITQYGLYVTNIDKRSDVESIGVSSHYDDNSTNDVANKGIVTPGAVDLTTELNVGYQAYPIITQFGAPDAYFANGSPNPDFGRNPVILKPDGTYWTTTASGADIAQVVPGGGSIRSNATTRFFGLDKVYLNSKSYHNYFANNATLPQPNVLKDAFLNEGIEIDGDLLLDKYSDKDFITNAAKDLDVQDADLLINPNPPVTSSPTPPSIRQFCQTPSAMAGPTVVPTGAVNPSTGFDSWNGTVRDGRSGSDLYGYPREVKRVDPPVIDSISPSTGLTRYRDMAINSPPRVSDWNIKNPGLYGFGKIIYVDNKNDRQLESSVAGAGYSLPDEWLNRNPGITGANKGKWTAGIYTPPGVEITIGDLRPYGYQPASTGSGYGIYMLRHDVDDNGNAVTWKNPKGPTSTPTDSSNQGMMVSYDELDASNATFSANNPNPNNDVIIVVEGNARIHGIVSAVDNMYPTSAQDALPRHITIVCYGTAYIEGNLLRGHPSSSIAVLAHDYVTVNTTQLTAGHVIQDKPTGTTPPAPAIDDPSAFDFGDSTGLAEEFSSGLPASVGIVQAYGNAGTLHPTPQDNDLALYVAGQPNAAGVSSLDINIYNPRLNLPGVIPSTYLTPLQTVNFGTGTGTAVAYPGMTTFPIGQHQYNELTTGPTTTLDSLLESQPLQLWLTKSPASTADSASSPDPELSRVAILPMDIRIEAILYAQTRSFFVIPGEWFNNHPDDTIDKYAQTVSGQAFTARGGGIDNTKSEQARFPFYGQPIDMKITVYGAVSEAHTADIGAQTDWMKKWGWIPQYHGSLNGFNPAAGTFVEYSGHLDPYWTPTNNEVPSLGLSIVYDPQCGYPFAANQFMREDANSLPLPFAPRLPVCPGLLSSGQAPQLPSS